MNLLPRSGELVRPVMEVLKSGQVLTNQEIRDQVHKLLNLSEEQIKLIHSGTRTELEYRLGWARTRAKQSRLIESPSRESWRITELGLSFLGQN